jgi:DNA-binding protein
MNRARVDHLAKAMAEAPNPRVKTRALGAAMRLRVNTVSILRHLFSDEVQIMLDTLDYLD